MTSVRGTCKPKHVRRILYRVIQAQPGENIVNYAFFCGRNWAIDQQRKREAAVRIAERRREKLERERQISRNHERAEREFLRLVDRLSPALSDLQQCHLEIVWLICFGGSTDTDCAEMYPGSKRDQRYQWKRRGVKLVLPHASENLVNHLRINGHRPS